MRLIDADELMKHKGNCYDEEGHLLYAVGTGDIMRTPTIDAVPVVRCKDCKHYSNHDKRCKVWNHGIDSNGYCHKGERRNDEQT